jgi:RNA polymerase sigma-70 factor (ECF subfamily)
VFVLRHIEHFSLQEIADITEVSLGTVKSRLFYATQKMATQMKVYQPTGIDQLFKHF